MVNSWRREIVGLDAKVPVKGGRLVPFVNLDNAASTPPLKSVVERVLDFLPYYANVHRGDGLKSRLSTLLYEQARSTVASFFGVDEGTNTVIFAKNATEAINRLAHSLRLTQGDVVVASVMEHHSNDLPWRARARVEYVDVAENGELDRADFLRKLKRHRAHLKLVAVTGGSNVTGLTNDVHWLAEAAHRHGARILIDAAQLAAHRPIAMLPDDDPGHLDFLAVSAHKMYAPFGSGALIGPRSVFAAGPPDHAGGGTVNAVTLTDVNWADIPDRNEAGTPNVIGAVAFAAALEALKSIGIGRIAAYEARLTAYALARLGRLSGVRLYGCFGTGPENADHAEQAGLAEQAGHAVPTDRLGIIALNVEGVPHEVTATALSLEGGIGVRSGCFCARPYVHKLLGLSNRDVAELFRRIVKDGTPMPGRKPPLPGLVRLSFGFYNTTADIDAVVAIMVRIAANPDRYRLDAEYGPLALYDGDADAVRVLRKLRLAGDRWCPPRR